GFWPFGGLDWPYLLPPPIGAQLGTLLPPSQKIPIEWHDPQRPIWGLQWQYGYTVRSQAPGAAQQAPPGGTTPPPGALWGISGAAAPYLEVYGYYDPWRTPTPVQIAALITPPATPPGPPPQSLA